MMRETLCLNPFEVREVLQVMTRKTAMTRIVSIPLKSGRCCKINGKPRLTPKGLNPFEVREVLQAM